MIPQLPIFIMIDSAEMGRKVQLALFEEEVVWRLGGTNVKYPYAREFAVSQSKKLSFSHKIDRHKVMHDPMIILSKIERRL